MSRYADPLAVREVSLGACQCPGTPHETDTATIRWQISGSAMARIGRAELERSVNLDPFAAYRQTVWETLVSWNLLWLDPSYQGKGERKAVPIPINPSTIGELDDGTLRVLAETADQLISSEGSLPNDSGAPSAESSPESASPIPEPIPLHTTSSSP